jgi:hypothetical protein
MIKKTILIVFTMVLVFTTLRSDSLEQKGLQIAIENEKANNGFKGEYMETEMILVNAHGDETVRRMTSRQRETKEDGDMSVITFLWPADVKGTRMLTHSHKKRDDDQWLYLPSLKRVKRISSRNKSGSFMGSEFAYEDLGSQEAEKYTYKWLKDVTLEGRECWLLEQVPVSKKSGYSKEINWIDKEYRQPLKIEYYDRKGELLKVAVFNEYKKLENWWRFHQIRMENVQTRKISTIRWNVRKLTPGYPEDEFESEALSDN